MPTKERLLSGIMVAQKGPFEQISQKYHTFHASVSRLYKKEANSTGAKEGSQQRAQKDLHHSTTMSASTEQVSEAPPQLIKTRLLILSDTHGHTPSPSTSIPFHDPLPEADVLLHCGDLTMVGLLSEYQKTLNILSTHPAPLKLVIAGNHDISLDEPYFARRGKDMHRSVHQDFDPDLPAKARALWTSPKALAAGVRYLDEGTHTFTLANGARLRVFASAYTPEFCDWGFAYGRDEQRFERLVPKFPGVDVLMTHGPPYGVLDATNRGEKVGCADLLRAAWWARPQVHCFGHIHEGWGAQRVEWKDAKEGKEEKMLAGGKVLKRVEDVETEREDLVIEGAACVDVCKGGKWEVERGRQTLMVNASIMNVRYDPLNAPWLVDVELEKAEEEGKQGEDET